LSSLKDLTPEFKDVIPNFKDVTPDSILSPINACPPSGACFDGYRVKPGMTLVMLSPSVPIRNGSCIGAAIFKTTSPRLDPWSNESMSTDGGLCYWLGLLLQSLRIPAIPGGQIPSQTRYDADDVLAVGLEFETLDIFDQLFAI